MRTLSTNELDQVSGGILGLNLGAILGVGNRAANIGVGANVGLGLGGLLGIGANVGVGVNLGGGKGNHKKSRC